ncbi:excisionase family DNA binding protein [Mucilaginibacter sp. UYP25]|uniref:helix-turn-helix domain-containing protein n=1 Tax=unclassified Mucilaginibacter TaxID=2617802 RepID=UPI00339B83C1
MLQNHEEYQTAVKHWNSLIEQSIRGLAELIRTESKNGVLEALSQSSIKPVNKVEDNDLLTRLDAANFLHVSLPTISRLQKNGTLTYFRVGRQVFFQKSDLLKATMVSPKKSGAKYN